MPNTVLTITVDPYGQSVAVTITQPSSLAFGAYTTRDGSTLVTFPKTITTRTVFYMDTAHRYNVSLVGPGGENGNGQGGVATLDLRGGNNASLGYGSPTSTVSGTSLPAQTGNGGKFLQTDGTATSWATAGTSVASLTPTAVKTSAYSAAASDLVPVDTTSGNVTVTLPTAPADKTQVAVKHVVRGGTNTVTVACAGSDVLNKAGGSTSATLTVLNQTVVFQYQASGAIWYVTGGDLPLSQLDLRFLGLSTAIPESQVTNLTTDLAAKAATTYVDAADALRIPLSTVTAAGDLIVGTGAGTVGRLAKGSPLYLLRVNSAGTALEFALAGTDNPVYATHNVTPGNLKYGRAALSACRNNTRDFKMISQGDSIAAATTGLTTPLTENYMRKAAAALALKTGLTCRMGVVPVYPYNTGTTVSSQWTVGSGWSADITAGWTGHYGAKGTAGSAGTLDFTPTDDLGNAIQVDSFIVYAYGGGTAGNFQWAIDAGGYTTQTVTAVIAQGLNAFSVSAGAVGAHTLHIKAPAAGNLPYIFGVEAVNSTVRCIKWMIGGVSSTTTPSSATIDTFVKAFAPDIVIPEWSTNDYGFQVALATFQSRVSAYAANIPSMPKPADCLWLGAIPQSASLTIPQQSYQDTLDLAADATGFGVLHIDKQMVSYAVANASPMSLMNDTVHPNATGHNFVGNSIASLLATL